MLKIRVPATTANLGCGFDSIGMALSIYNYVTIEESEKKLEIVHLQDATIPTNEEHLIYKTMTQFCELVAKPKIQNIKLTQEDHIPLTRGLGSSAACIVAGVLAANELSGAKVSQSDLAYIAAKMEGHPDNSTPALLGGVVVGALSDHKLDYIKLDVKQIEQLQFGVMIPNFQLSTEKARNILPKEYNIKDVVFNVSRAALLVAAFSTGDFSKLGNAMQDRLHQPYRQQIIPNMENIFNHATDLGAIATYLSGAGPTLIAVYTKDNFIDQMNNYLSTLEGGWAISSVKPDLVGAVVEKSTDIERASSSKIL